MSGCMTGEGRPYIKLCISLDVSPAVLPQDQSSILNEYARNIPSMTSASIIAIAFQSSSIIPEQAGMSCNAAQCIRVTVRDLTLNHLVRVHGVVFARSTLVPLRRRHQKPGIDHPQLHRRTRGISKERSISVCVDKTNAHLLEHISAHEHLVIALRV